MSKRAAHNTTPHNTTTLHTVLQQYTDTDALPDTLQYTVTQADVTGHGLHALVTLCDLYIALQQFAVPISLLTQAYALSPDCVVVLDTLALCYIESDKCNDTAESYLHNTVQLLQRSIQLQPEQNIIKYCYLAQCSAAVEAVKLYQRAIELYTQQLHQLQAQNTNNSNSNGETDDDSNAQELIDTTQQQLQACYVSIVELYMTDLCDDADAESTCNNMLDKAIAVNGESVEVLYALANLRYIQQQYDASRDYCVHAYNNTVQLHEQLAAQDTIYSSSVVQAALPSYELRLNICKLLIEHELYRQALHLLETQLLNESDIYIEVLHLTAVCYAALHNYSAALQYIQQCNKYCRKLPLSERPSEIVSALKQLKQHCDQQIAAGKQKDAADSDDEAVVEENAVMDDT